MPQATLYVIATPIGNLEDITYRAVRTLGRVDALACEDTRVTRKLLSHYGIARPQMFACQEHNEARSAKGILKLLDAGRSVGLCSNAGMPAVSDPGYRVISGARAAGHRVEVIPGASAVDTALVASGLPTSSFTFLGFAPRKAGQRRRWLAREAEAPHTLVALEAPSRLPALLADALAVLGDRRAAVAVELTKMFESVEDGWLSELAERFAEPVRGEVTVVIAGASRKFRRDGAAPGDG